MSFDWNLLDWIFIAITFFSILIGLIRGFVKELLSLIFLILAVVVSVLFYKDIGRGLFGFIDSSDLANFLGFVTGFTIILSFGFLITFFLKKLIIIGPIKSIDRLLGSVFGFFRAILICSIIVFAILAFPGDRKNLIKNSQFSPYVFKAMKVLMGFIPENLKKGISV